MKTFPAFVDCDIHPSVTDQTPIEPFISAKYREAILHNMGHSPWHGFMNPYGVNRRDAVCGSYDDLKALHLDRYNILYGVIQSPGYAISLIHNIDVANAMASAWNDWQIEHYLRHDDRLKGSISVNMNDPVAAVREIERHAGDSRFVQVLANAEQLHLLGHRCYHPIYEACQAAGLVFALHPGTEGTLNSSTPIGRPSGYFEWHNIIPITFMAHLNSLVIEGVFEKFPGMKLLLTEGGIGWLPHLMWRMDKNFKGLRKLAPWLHEPPSHYILRQVRLTTQPIEEPLQSRHLMAIFEMIQADRTLCFSSDFPHWDFDDPLRVLPSSLDAVYRQRILVDNALELFGLPQPAPPPEVGLSLS